MTDFRNPQSLTIPNGTAVSNVLDFTEGYSRNIVGVHLTSPGTLPETITVETSSDYTVAGAGSATWGTLQSGGSDVTLAASKSTQITEIVAAALRLKSGVNVAADRVFKVVGSVRK